MGDVMERLESVSDDRKRRGLDLQVALSLILLVVMIVFAVWAVPALIRQKNDSTDALTSLDVADCRTQALLPTQTSMSELVQALGGLTQESIDAQMADLRGDTDAYVAAVTSMPDTQKRIGDAVKLVKGSTDEFAAQMHQSEVNRSAFLAECHAASDK